MWVVVVRPIHVSPPTTQYTTTYWNFEGKNSGYSVRRHVQRMARVARTDIRTEMLNYNCNFCESNF